MNKLLSVVLVITMLIGGFPLIVPTATVSAEEEPPAETPNNSLEDPASQDDYIYYSDLFYNYSAYLNSIEIQSKNITAQAAMNQAFNEYLSSPNFKLSRISEHINLTTNLPQLFRDYSDLIAETEFRYNDSLDAANIKFVSAVLSASAEQNKRISDIQDIGKDTKEYNQILKILSVGSKTYEKVNDVIKTLPEIKYYSDSDWSTLKEPFDFALDYLKPSSIALSQKIPSLKNGFISFSTVLKSCSTAKDIYEMFYSLIISICMEDMRMSLIEDIISTQPAGSVLYEGMTRLKTQLSGGWASYFVSTYLENKLINQVFSVVSKKFTTTMMEKAGALCTSLQNPESLFHAQNLFSDALTHINTIYTIFSITISLVNTAFFNWILEVPSPKDYQVAMILAQYSTAMFDGLTKKQSVFQSPFGSNEIEKYEVMFDAYSASINCALDACGNLESNLIPLSSETKTALNSAKALFSDNSLYSDYIDGVIQTIKAIPVENRTITEYGTWNAGNSFTLSGPADVITSGTIYCNHLKANILSSSVNSGIMNIPEGQNMLIDGNLTFEHQNFTLTVPENSRLIANNIKIRSVGTTGSGHGDFYNNGEILSEGNFELIGSYSYYWGGAKGVYTENTGKIIAQKNMTLNTVADTLKNSGLLQCGETFTVRDKIKFNNSGSVVAKKFVLLQVETMSYPVLSFSDSSVMRISGDMDCSSYSQTIGGTLVLNGDTQQNVNGLHVKNLSVENVCGIKNAGGMQVYGYFSLNGNPIENEGSTKPYVYSSTTFDSVSNFGNLYIAYENTVTLTNNVTANFSGGQEGGILIPKNTSVEINGNIDIAWGKFTNKGICRIIGNLRVRGRGSEIRNEGDLSVSGNLTIPYADNGEYGNLVMQTPNSRFCIGGNASLPYSFVNKISQGTLIFTGTQAQTIEYLNAPIMIIENASEEGVIFTRSISPGILFDHRQNHFTLNSGGTFVDYDCDGMKDNVDPYPTVGNACTLLFNSNDPEFGSVSETEIHTVGGTTVSITASPTFKYRFEKWIDASNKTLSTEASYSFVAKTDQTITAVFAKRKQPITVQTENGRINVVSSAEIESDVSATVTENAGYIFDDTSLKYNDISIENNRFIMPDEPVTITATFNRNDAYFALRDKIDEVAAIKYNDYSAESFAALTEALTAARAGLNNHISEQDSQQLIAALQSAIDGLESKYPVSISVKNTPVLYVGFDNLRAQIVVTQHYDNSTSETVTDYTVTGFDCNFLGEQQIEITYNGLSANYNVTVQRRPLSLCEISGVTDLNFEKNSPAEQVLTITYQNGDVLTAGIDFEVHYTDNTTPGLAFIEISGIGNYTGAVAEYFTIHCNHQFAIIEDTPAACTTPGRTVEGCTICGAENETFRLCEELPESPHNYSNNMNETYTLNYENAVCYRLRFSTNTQFENNYDKLSFYNAENELLGAYTGTALSGQTIEVNGSSVTMVLTTNGSRTYYGFSLDYVDVTYAVEKKTESPALGHDYQQVITDPTCTADGYTTFTCSRCNNSYTANETVALNHNWGMWTLLNEAQHTRVCSRDSSHVETEGHSFDTGSVTVAPTCMAAGIKTFICAVCHGTITEVLDPSGHDYGEWIVSKEPTCTEVGEMVRTCRYDESHKEIAIIEKIDHVDVDNNDFCDNCGEYYEKLKPDEICPFCEEVHAGTIGRILLFFHKIVFRLKSIIWKG